MGYSALVFDLFGTLLDVTTVEAACATVTPDSPAFVSLWRAKQLEYSWLRTLMGRYEDFERITTAALDYAVARFRLSLAEDDRSRLLSAWLTLQPYPEVPAALERLRVRPLAVLSNGSPRMLEECLRASGLRGRFRHVLSVDEVHVFKPAPAVYALAEQRLGFSRRTILFVSSNAWDVAGAGACGFPVAWVNRTSAPVEGLGVVPDLVVRNVTELADLVLSER